MIKRAFFYITRKTGKTLILLLTLFIISTFVLDNKFKAIYYQAQPGESVSG